MTVTVGFTFTFFYKLSCRYHAGFSVDELRERVRTFFQRRVRVEGEELPEKTFSEHVMQNGG